MDVITRTYSGRDIKAGTPVTGAGIRGEGCDERRGVGGGPITVDVRVRDEMGGSGLVAEPLSPFAGNSTVLPGLGNSPASPSQSVSYECTSRWFVSLQTAVHGITGRLSSVEADPLSVSNNIHKTVCNISQCTTPQICCNLHFLI